jgi:hypothetical protein
MADIIALLSAIVGVAASLGGGLMLQARDDYRRAARIAFYVAGIAFWFLGVALALDVAGQPLVIRMVIAAAVGAFAAAGLVWAISLAAVDVQKTAGPVSSATNKIGTIKENSGIVTQGQDGDNSLSK